MKPWYLHVAAKNLLKNKKVDEIDWEGMDDEPGEERAFVHLKYGWKVGGTEGYDLAHSKSAGSVAEAREIINEAEPCNCKNCAAYSHKKGK